MVDLARARTASTLRTCTIITTAANSAIAPLHDRMPVILHPADEAAWLDRPLRAAAARAPRPLSPPARPRCAPSALAVNDARYDGPECLEPPAPDPQAALF